MVILKPGSPEYMPSALTAELRERDNFLLMVWNIGPGHIVICSQRLTHGLTVGGWSVLVNCTQRCLNVFRVIVAVSDHTYLVGLQIWIGECFVPWSIWYQPKKWNLKLYIPKHTSYYPLQENFKISYIANFVYSDWPAYIWLSVTRVQSQIHALQLYEHHYFSRLFV